MYAEDRDYGCERSNFPSWHAEEIDARLGPFDNFPVIIAIALIEKRKQNDTGNFLYESLMNHGSRIRIYVLIIRVGVQSGKFESHG